MKKKGPRAIPDFSSKKKPASSSPTVDTKDTMAPANVATPPARVVKPHSTSAKSGRRGS